VKYNVLFGLGFKHLASFNMSGLRDIQNVMRFLVSFFYVSDVDLCFKLFLCVYNLMAINVSVFVVCTYRPT